MREVSMYWTKDGKRILSIDYGYKIEEIEIGSVKIKKDKK